MTDRKEHGSWLEIDRARLLHNFDGCKRLVDPAEVIAVVTWKARVAGLRGLRAVKQVGHGQHSNRIRIEVRKLTEVLGHV